MTRLIFQIICVTVQINRVRLPAILLSFSLYRYFFSLLVYFFFTLFFLLAFFSLLLLQTLLVMRLDQYIFKLKSGILIWKRDFKSSWSAYWPSFKQIKTISCQDMSLLWNSWIFFNVSWHHDKHTQYTTNCTNLHPPVTHWRNLNLPATAKRTLKGMIRGFTGSEELKIRTM